MGFFHTRKGSITVSRVIIDLGCFSQKFLIQFFICQGYLEMRAYSLAIFYFLTVLAQLI